MKTATVGGRLVRFVAAAAPVDPMDLRIARDRADRERTAGLPLFEAGAGLPGPMIFEEDAACRSRS